MTIKIAVCPNAFRESMTSVEAAKAIANGLIQSLLDCFPIEMPLADGGNGTLEVWQQATGAKLITVPATGPLGQSLEVQFGLKGHTAMVEMARASGIELMTPAQRNPLKTTTYGTGELIKAAIEHGATEILVGLGGSGTVDGGAGCLQAMGAKLLDVKGHPIDFGGGKLNELAHIDTASLDSLLDGITIRVLCDVDNPLSGERGAAPVFGPQKGATPAMVAQLSKNLAHFADIVARDVGVQIANVPATGAAGGISGGLYGVAKADLVSGVNTMIEACGYETILAEDDIALLITGEGQIDFQTASGKAPLGIATIAQHYGIPVIALAGAVTTSLQELATWGFSGAFSILPKLCPLPEALENGQEWLHNEAMQIGNILALGMQFAKD